MWQSRPSQVVGRLMRLRWARALAVAASLVLAACAVRSNQPATGPAPTASEAARFLTQATFGPTDGSISQVRTSGYSGWIDQQLLMAPQGSYLADMDARLVELLASNPGASLGPPNFYEVFWRR